MTDQMTDEPTTGEEHPKGSRVGLLLPIAIPVVALVAILLILFGFSRILLSLSPGAATTVALIVAASILTIAALIASRERMTNGALFSMVGAVAGVAMLAGGVAILAIGKGGGEGGKPTTKPQVITLAAPKGAAATGFAQTSLTAQAGLPIDLRFDNQDPGVQHNVVIFAQDPTKNPQAPALFTGDLISGPATTTYNVPALKAGTYYFHCAVHPTTMTGTITVGASGGGGVTLVAQGIQFDTKEIDLPPDVATTLAFDNKDAGTPHNVAIYSDPQRSKTLFKGDLVVGPATKDYELPPLQPGTYYFQCDVHPTMNGSVVVGGGTGGSGATPTPSASPS